MNLQQLFLEKRFLRNTWVFLNYLLVDLHNLQALAEYALVDIGDH